MIEATCTACGTVNRIADADVPVGAKFVNCASCKSRVGIPARTAAAATKPGGAGTALDFADLPAPRRPSALGGEPAKPEPDFADLPAPRRQSALGGEPAKPAPRSGLAAAEAAPEAELPAPRSKKPGPPAVAAPSAGPLDLDDLLAPDGGVDLPAPRPAGAKGATDLPAPRAKVEPSRPGGGRAMTDLPVPGVADTSPLADLPSPKPKTAQDVTDLPAPRPKAPMPPMPTPPKVPAPPLPKAPSAIADLPSPKPKSAPVVPNIPKPPAPGAVVDLPTPKPHGITNLPTPKPLGIADLPAPKPGQVGELPAPKGFFDDLPQSAGHDRQNQGATELPAPKGFFEDLPQPARNQPQASSEIAPKGFFEDLPGKPTGQKPSTEIAPKGFFEDLPGRPTGPQKPGNEIAPKGFFDDLPGKPIQKPSSEVAPKGYFEDLPAKPNTQKPGNVAPKGFFDDLPGKPTQKPSTDVAPKGFFDDLPKPSQAQPGADDSLDLDPEPSQAGIELELGDADTHLELEEDGRRAKKTSVAPAPGPSNQFDDLDLSEPSAVSFQKTKASQPGAAPGPVATINPQSAAAAAAAVRPALPSAIGPIGPKGGDVALELEEPKRGGPTSASATPKLAPKQTAEAKKASQAEKKARGARSRKIVGIVLLVLVALGGGGYYMYRRHAKQQAHEAAVSEQLVSARKSIAASQWQKATVSASKALELSKTNAEALGIRAEAAFALGIVEGGNQARFGQARKSLADALKAGVAHPALVRAQALSPLAANQPDQAIKKLQVLVAAAPKDGSLQLYLGWANSALGDYAAAITAFDVATTLPTAKVHALFGRARAKQAKGDLEGARADYGAILDVQKEHIGAQVGLASTLPAAQAQQQESDLLAILAIKDIEKKEPRAAMQAWMLAADVAKKGGRMDVARERFRKALAIAPQDVGVLTGLAEVELRDNKLDVALEMADKALKVVPTDVRATLISAEIAIGKKQYDVATQRLDALANRQPPIPALDQARMKLLFGRLLEAQGKEQDAIDAYLEAAKLAGDQDLTPRLMAVAKLTELAEKAAAANDPARASELRKKADALLGELSASAEKDPLLALTLGMAYLQTNDPVKAETWLRKAVDGRPKDVDAQYQLAKALAKQNKNEDAIARLRLAVDLDPTRSEIGLELARTYEDSKRNADAEKLYDKLLAAKEPTLELRARAGRFFARIGEMKKAGEQGAKILEAQDDNAAGLYLKGESLFAEGKIDNARRLFAQASDIDPEPQYLDARGRAAEQWAKDSGNSTYQDDALRSYGKATETDPTMFTSWLGQGRLYVARKEDAKAQEPLQKAWALKQTAEVARLMGIATKNINLQPGVAAKWLEQSYAMEAHADTAYHLGIVYTNEEVNNPKAAINAFENATRLALAEEKKGNPAPPWLTDALYQLGDIHRTLHQYKQAKSAWEKWLQRNPPKNERWKEVSQAMATLLKDL